MVGAEEIVLWAALFGLLVGIVWSLKYVVIIDRRIERLEEHMESLLEKGEGQERHILGIRKCLLDV